MATAIVLYGKPLSDADPINALAVSGVLPSAQKGQAYRGTLSIQNAVGKCTVRVLESDLPPNAQVFVDNFSNSVVVTWPLTPVPAPPQPPKVLNGDFESGDDGSWRKGAGWSIEASAGEGSSWGAVYANNRGVSGIYSPAVPYSPGIAIHASARFQQGASSAGNLTGNIQLVWCDDAGNPLVGGEGVGYSSGNVISSGSNGAFKTTEVTAAHQTAPKVSVGIVSNRKRQNRRAAVDNVVWDYTYDLPIQNLWRVSIEVTDSLNRVAYWSGTISAIMLNLTTDLLGWYSMDELAHEPRKNSHTITGLGPFYVTGGGHAPGVVGNCYYKNWSGAFVAYARGAEGFSLPATGDWTVAAMFKKPNTASACSVINKGDLEEISRNQQFHISLDNHGLCYLTVANHTGSYQNATDLRLVTRYAEGTNDENWHAVIAWRLGNRLYLQIDDRPPQSVAIPEGFVIYQPVAGSVCPAKIGELTTSINTGPVYIDELGLWVRALTTTEREYLYNSGQWRAYNELGGP